MKDWIIFGATIALGFMLLYFLFFFSGWVSSLLNIKFYEKQGIKICPGSRTFIIANMIDVIQMSKERKKNQLPTKAMYNWIMDNKLGDGTFDSFKPDEHGGVVLLAFIGGKIQLLISDPDMVQELFTTRNLLTDKTTQNEVFLKDLLGNSFLFSKADELWKSKRKASAHAFYKERLNIMMEVFKSKVEFYFNKWNKEIEASPNKSYKIDITEVFELIYSDTIISISFGEDISDQKFEV